MNRRKTAILAIALSLGLLLGACGDNASSPADDNQAENDDGGGDASFTVTVSADGIEIPDEVPGGVVEVTLEADNEEAEINFSKIAAGTTEDEFKEAIAKTLSGGPIPAFIEAETGVLGHQGGGKATLILPEGDYIAWSERGSDEEGEGGEGGEGGEAAGEGDATTTSQALEGEAPDAAEEEGEGEQAKPEDFLTATFTATGGETGDLPSAEGGQVTARDYTFDVNLSGDDEEFVFRNEGPDQFHHVVLFNFGDIEPAVVEKNLPAFFESEEDAPPPPAFKDLDFENLEAGGSTVLSPGLATTASGKIESGNTYAAVCFINDKKGGPPHAIGHGMFTVFAVD